MTHRAVLLGITVLLMPSSSTAGAPPPPRSLPPAANVSRESEPAGQTERAGTSPSAGQRTPRDDMGDLDARRAVRVGNKRLIEGRPAEALEAYRHAERLKPDAREIAFVEGLAHYDLDEFDQAREAFRKATALAHDALADDALYSLGATDHREALRSIETNPQLAVSLLESAMQRYHDVLAKRPGHKAARDANFKAASVWRELKQRLEEQQQQESDQDQDQNRQDDKQQRQDEQQQQDENEKNEKSRQTQPQNQDERKQQEQRSDTSEQPEKQQRQQSKGKKQEQVSREQAERRLREMMQAIRDRKKIRRRRAPKVPIAPVDKDW